MIQPAAREGVDVSTHALVLGTIPLKESHKLVKLLTLDFGKISAVARGAARSTKRFSGALEPMNHIRIYLKSPRDSGVGASGLWLLEKAELQSSFLHLRQSFAALETSLFFVKIIEDLLPDGPLDPSIFKILGRFLRDIPVSVLETRSSLLRVIFWSWLAKHMGYGEIAHAYLGELKNESLLHDWVRMFSETDFNMLHMETFLKKVPPLENEVYLESQAYRQWTERSGLHWEHFEKWLTSKRLSSF